MCIRFTWKAYENRWLGPTHRFSGFIGSGFNQRKCISNKFPGDAVAFGPGSTVQEPLFERKLLTPPFLAFIMKYSRNGYFSMWECGSKGLCDLPSFQSFYISVVFMTCGLLIHGSSDCSIKSSGDFTHGKGFEYNEKGAGRKGSCYPFGLPSTSMCSPQFGKSYPKNVLLIFSQVWIRSSKMQKEKHSFGVKMTWV